MIHTGNSNSVVMKCEINIDEWLCEIIYPVDVPFVEPVVSAGSEVDLPLPFNLMAVAYTAPPCCPAFWSTWGPTEVSLAE